MSRMSRSKLPFQGDTRTLRSSYCCRFFGLDARISVVSSTPSAMAPLLDKLPTIMVLAVLVGIFVALRQHGRSNPLQLWTTAWILIFIHFVAQAFETQGHPSVFDAIDLSALQVAAIVFIGSLTPSIGGKKT